jgi:hypothetical protein
LGKDIAYAEGALQKVVERTAVFHESLEEPPNGGCIQLGRLVLLILETAWGWIGKDGQVVQLFNREVAVHSEVRSTFGNMKHGSELSPRELMGALN